MVTSDLRGGNIAISWMRNASYHNYRNSSVIVDLAISTGWAKKLDHF